MENMWNEKRLKDTGGHGMISDEDTESGLIRPLISTKASDPVSKEENPSARTLKNVVTIH